MTFIEFSPIFHTLMQVYGYERKLRDGQVRSFYEYLKGHQAKDFRAACLRLPAIELATPAKPFPTAACIQHYIEDAKEARRFTEKNLAPHTLEEVSYRGRGGIVDESPGGMAWKDLMVLFIRRGTGNYRQALSKAFQGDWPDWLKANPSVRDAIQDYCQHDYGYEEYLGPSFFKQR